MSEKILEISRNKKARFEFEILETFEAGLVLKGTEVKSLRMKKVNISDSYAKVTNGEVFLHQMHVSPYTMGNRFNHDEMRIRKLLLHKNEIKKLFGKIREKGYTLVPLKLYFKNGRAKIELALARGKATYDKRETIKKRESDRELKRALKFQNQ